MDLIENHFHGSPSEGQIAAYSDNQIEEFRFVVDEFSAAQSVLRTEPETTYLGGWLGANWSQPGFKEERLAALLYYPRILVHDPLSDFFFDGFSRVYESRPIRYVGSGASVMTGPATWGRSNTWAALRGDPERARTILWRVVQSVMDLAPLIRIGVLQIRSQWPTLIKRQTALQTAVRYDVMNDAMRRTVDAYEHVPPEEKILVWDNFRGLRVSLNEVMDLRDEPWVRQHEYLYLAKTLAVADQAGASYSPGTAADLALLRTKALQIPGLRTGPEHPGLLLQEVARFLLPDFDLKPADAVRMRETDTDFADWRSRLSKLARASHADTSEELTQRIHDELAPEVHRLERSARNSSFMSIARDHSFTAVVTTGAGVAVSGLTGGNPGLVAGAGVASGVLSWIWNAYKPPSLGGQDAVLASLLRSKRGR